MARSTAARIKKNTRHIFSDRARRVAVFLHLSFAGMYASYHRTFSLSVSFSFQFFFKCFTLCLIYPVSSIYSISSHFRQKSTVIPNSPRGARYDSTRSCIYDPQNGWSGGRSRGRRRLESQFRCSREMWPRARISLPRCTLPRCTRGRQTTRGALPFSLRLVLPFSRLSAWITRLS